MRIIFDDRTLIEKNPCGVKTYASDMFRALRQLDNIIIPLNTWVPNRLLNMSMGILNVPSIERITGDADIVYLPNINFIATKKPLVVTVHDLSFVHYPHFFSLKQRLWHKLIHPQALLRRASHIIAISETIKEDIVRVFGVSPKKITVISPTVSHIVPQQEDKERVKKQYQLPEKFFFFLGTLEPRKNIEGVIHAFENINDDSHLLIAGAKGWLYSDIFRAAKYSPKREKIRFLGVVPEKDKVPLLALAYAFVYPSFYEGFGIPCVEAMMVGTPVIASTGGALPEVVGQSGLLPDPYFVDDITEAMIAVSTDDALRSSLIIKGQERVQKFSQNNSAEKLEKIFRELL